MNGYLIDAPKFWPLTVSPAKEGILAAVSLAMAVAKAFWEVSAVLLLGAEELDAFTLTFSTALRIARY